MLIILRADAQRTEQLLYPGETLATKQQKKQGPKASRENTYFSSRSWGKETTSTLQMWAIINKGDYRKIVFIQPRCRIVWTLT